jgi:hypothetical protein
MKKQWFFRLAKTGPARTAVVCGVFHIVQLSHIAWFYAWPFSANQMHKWDMSACERFRPACGR